MSTAPRTPVVFVHGLWLHGTSWDLWIDLFREAGYEPSAPGWPGDGETVEETRASADRVAGHGIDDVVRGYVDAFSKVDGKPIVVGHSFGGLIAQRLLTEGHASAAVAVDAAPIKGILFLPPSSLRVAGIVLRNPANRKRAVALTRKQFRYGFGNALREEECDQLYDRWTIPSPGRPLFEGALANFTPGSPAKVDTKKSERGPLLLTLGGKDHTVAPAIPKQALKLYGKSSAVTDLKEFPDRGHSLTIDHRWREIAETVLEWLKGQSL
jgi:non-heme chloroperoxidase